MRYIAEGRNTAFEDINSAQFVAALQAGSADAYDTLVDRLLPHIVRFIAFGKSVPEPDAEELAIDILMTVHERVGTFRHGGRARLTTWIFEIAKNRAIDFHRANRAVEVEFTEDVGAVGDQDNSGFSGRNRELLKWLAQQLEHFSEQDQLLLKWRAVEIPYSQIAEWLGITEGTARVRHKRAMEKLLANASLVPVPKGARENE